MGRSNTAYGVKPLHDARKRRGKSGQARCRRSGAFLRGVLLCAVGELKAGATLKAPFASTKKDRGIQIPPQISIKVLT
ncbi:hypothetical protein HMPREF1869_00462 [Bacteroidales bacterium KA00251]|nr:hypothetical protein HMPREF1869_00462 [Bacteroidales bacterium KA00251]